MFVQKNRIIMPVTNTMPLMVSSLFYPYPIMNALSLGMPHQKKQPSISPQT